MRSTGGYYMHQRGRPGGRGKDFGRAWESRFLFRSPKRPGGGGRRRPGLSRDQRQIGRVGVHMAGQCGGRRPDGVPGRFGGGDRPAVTAPGRSGTGVRPQCVATAAGSNGNQPRTRREEMGQSPAKPKRPKGAILAVLGGVARSGGVRAGVNRRPAVRPGRIPRFPPLRFRSIPAPKSARVAAPVASPGCLYP